MYHKVNCWILSVDKQSPSEGLLTLMSFFLLLLRFLFDFLHTKVKKCMNQ